MSEEHVFKLIKGSKEVSSLPQVLAEVIRVADREDATAKDMAEIILKDPALTTRLLRLVNSSMYGKTRKISTINQAVISLGIRAVKAMALSTSLYRMFSENKAVVSRMRFWRHSLETAIACREIAGACDYKPAEEAFVVGLMHDIGILTMEANFPQQFKTIWARVEQGEDLAVLEEKMWGTNHARVGKFLLDQWKLPEFMGEAIAMHHNDFSTAGQMQRNRLGCIVQLGNLVSKFRIPRQTHLDEKKMEAVDKFSDSLGIDPATLAEIQANILGLLHKESEFLEIEIGSITDLLEAANNLIYKQYFLVEKVLRDNRNMQEQIARNRMKKAALESLKTITATLSHYINNASATILGRAQLVQMAIAQGTVLDEQNIAGNCMELVIKSVKTITLTLDELKKLSAFETVPYSDKTSILDIEGRLKTQIEAIE